MRKIRSCGFCRFSLLKPVGGRCVLWCAIKEKPVKPSEAYECMYYAPPRKPKVQLRLEDVVRDAFSRKEDLAL